MNSNFGAVVATIGLIIMAVVLSQHNKRIKELEYEIMKVKLGIYSK